MVLQHSLASSPYIVSVSVLLRNRGDCVIMSSQRLGAGCETSYNVTNVRNVYGGGGGGGGWPELKCVIAKTKPWDTAGSSPECGSFLFTATPITT